MFGIKFGRKNPGIVTQSSPGSGAPAKFLLNSSSQPSKSRSAKDAAYSNALAEVPRYPPFKRGIPFLDSDLCLAQHNDILDRLRITLRFTSGEFELYARPPLKRFVDYVHLLPASKNHHHRAAGGLLRHSLEVALYAGMSAGGRVFGAEATMKVRSKLRRQYIYAAFILGLGHDVGKVFSDMVVTNKIDDVTWNPYTQALADWCKEHIAADHRYLVRFNRKRIHKHHEAFSTFALHCILGPEAIEFLTAAGTLKEPLESVIAVTSDSGRIAQYSDADELAKILKIAEKKSVDRDMKGAMDVVGTDTSETPFPVHIVAKINHLLHEEFMSANSPKSRLFIVDNQAFVAWDEAFSDMLFYEFQKDGISIPKDSDKLLDAMIDHGLVHFENNPKNRPQIKVRQKNGIGHVFNVIELDSGAFSDLFDEHINTSCAVEIVHSKQASDKPPTGTDGGAETTPSSPAATNAIEEQAEERSEAVDQSQPQTPPKENKVSTATEKLSKPDSSPSSDSSESPKSDDALGLDEAFDPQQFLEQLIAANKGDAGSRSGKAPANKKEKATNTEAPGQSAAEGSSKGGQSAKHSRPPRKAKSKAASVNNPNDNVAPKAGNPRKPKTTPPEKKGEQATNSSQAPTKTTRTHQKTPDKRPVKAPPEKPQSDKPDASQVFFEMVKTGQVGEKFEVERAADAYHVIAVPNELYAFLGKELALPPYRVRSLLTHVYENEPDGIDSIRIIVPVGGPQKS
jgi:hypothetical protein